MTRSAPWLALLLAPLVLAPTTVLANAIQWAADCSDPLTPLAVFDATTSVCISGDVDFTCPQGLIDLPAADVYIVPAGQTDPFDPIVPETRLGPLFSAGGAFLGELVWAAPLLPGSYDVILDENCDGVFTANDVRASGLFAVVDPGAAVPLSSAWTALLVSCLMLGSGFLALRGRSL